MAETTNTDQPMHEDQLQIFLLMHRSMRQDATALAEAVERNGPSPALARWFTAFSAGIVHHHEVEDDIFWPLLAERSEDFRRAAAGLVDDHHRLDEAMTAVARSLAGHGDALGATSRLAEILEAHLDREEAAAIPAFLACLSAAEYDALHEEATRRSGMRGLAWVMPWLLDHASEEEAAEGVAAMPAAIRWMNARVWTPRYRRLAAPLRSLRRRSFSVVTAAAALLLALVAGVLSGCGGGNADAAGSPVTVVAQPPASHVTITATDYSFKASSQRIAAGRVQLTLRNEGTEAHQVQLGRVQPGTTVDSFVHAYHHHGSGAAEKLLEWQTGVNGVEPGRTGTVVGDVEPGHYLMVCFVPGHDGVSHIDKGMVVPIEVVAGGEPVAEPAAEGEVVIKD